MQQSDIDRTISLLYKGSDLTLKFITTFTDIIQCVLSQLDRDKSAKFLNDYIDKGGQCEFIECGKGLEREITQRLRQEGIRFVVTASSSMDGKKIIVFPEYSSPVVNRVVNEYQCEHNKGGITSKEYVNEMSKGQMRKVKDLNLYEAEMITGMAKQRGISVAVEEPSSGVYNIVYAKKDTLEMNNIKFSAALMKAHPEVFQVYKRHIDFKNDSMKKMLECVINKKDNIPIYLADTKGNTMIVTADKITYHEHGGVETVIDYSDGNREKKIKDYLVLMDNPVEFTIDEFNEYEKKSVVEKENTVFNKNLSLEAPKISDFERTEIEKMRNNRILYEQKLAQDNPEQEVYIYSYLNSEMKMDEFKDFEKINQESVHDRKELRETETPIIYDDARSFYRGFKDEPETVAYEDEKFAEAVIDYDLDEIDRLNKEFAHIDSMDDIRNDRNGNMIPDDFEEYQI